MIWLAVGTARQETCREVGWEPQAKLALSLPQAPQRYTQTRWYGTSEGLSLEEGTPGARPSRFPREHPVHPSYPVTTPPPRRHPTPPLPCSMPGTHSERSYFKTSPPCPPSGTGQRHFPMCGCLCMLCSEGSTHCGSPAQHHPHTMQRRLQWVLTCLLL